MKNILLLFVFPFLSLTSIQAQKVYFIYLQTENQQAFYAGMGDKIYYSTPSGYMILSNLRDSTYSVKIGIQGSQAADHVYTITINRKDQGFLIKQFGDKGWGLFNLITLVTTMPSGNPVSSSIQTVRTEKREDNAFTNLLAKAADDSTIKERPIIEKPVEKKVEPAVVITGNKEETKNEGRDDVPIKQEEIKKEILPIEKSEEARIDSAAIQKQIDDSNRAAQIRADSIIAAKSKEAELLKQQELHAQDSVEKAGTEIVSNVEYKRSTVKLRSESSTTAGIGLVFLDMQSDDVVDTIRILIPPESRKTTQIENKEEEKKFLDISSSDSVKKDDTKPVVIRGNNCKSVADDDDFFRLRKKMAGGSNDNSMIAEASRVFKTKCFSTTQIKNLSTLFLTDEYKYKFFDAAYEHVNDAENFASLQAELKDDYYINRFKAMLRF